jgi:hypothetical protein
MALLDVHRAVEERNRDFLNAELTVGASIKIPQIDYRTCQQLDGQREVSCYLHTLKLRGCRDLFQ